MFNISFSPFFCQVVNKAKQWWLVRNSRGEEGNVPLNLLEPASSDRSMDEPPVSFMDFYWETTNSVQIWHVIISSVQYAPRNAFGPVTLGMNSSPGEVKAWLEYKGFSRMWVPLQDVLDHTKNN